MNVCLEKETKNGKKKRREEKEGESVSGEYKERLKREEGEKRKERVVGRND